MDNNYIIIFSIFKLLISLWLVREHRPFYQKLQKMSIITYITGINIFNFVKSHLNNLAYFNFLYLVLLTKIYFI